MFELNLFSIYTPYMYLFPFHIIIMSVSKSNTARYSSSNRDLDLNLEEAFVNFLLFTYVASFGSTASMDV